MIGSLMHRQLMLPSLFPPSGQQRTYEEMSIEELEARLLVNDERLKLYRHVGRIAGFIGTFAIRKALMPK
ncbi:MAG: hypothetical protein WCE40_06635 [Polyangia bacterium]